MKKIYFSLTFAAALTIISACRQDFDEKAAEAQFTASIVQSVSTRTDLSGYSIVWNNGDAVSINGVTYKVITDSGSEDAFLAKDDTQNAPEAPYTAYYPASILDGGKTVLPSVQTYGSFSMNPMFAQSSDENLYFKNICAVLAITVNSSDMATVKAIRVSSANKALCGAFSVIDDIAVLESPDNTAASVTLDCGSEGVSTSADGTRFYISLPAQTYRSLKVEISENGTDFTKSITTKEGKDIVLEAGTVYPIGFDKLSTGGYNLFGYVRCGDTPLEGVVVSDGYEFAVTDATGAYRLKSEKEYGFVEISIPSGYRVPSKGVIPQFFARVKKEQYALERHDFDLVKDKDQTQHTMLFFTDIHLGNTYNIRHFNVFANDINGYISQHPDENIFACTGGDNSFDKKWYLSTGMLPADYLAVADSAFAGNGLQIFHCIGNHDHEIGPSNGPYPKGEIECSQKYKDAIGPTFYSYNIGKLHYICLDNIYCTNDGSGDASYECTLEPYMLEWLKKDLSYVSKDTPLVVQMHCPIFNYKGNLWNSYSNREEMIAAFEGRRTYVLSGHCHMLFSIDRLDDLNLIDLNSGSVCGDFWVTQNYNAGICINREGTPTGYRILNVDGTDVTWQYKGYGRPYDEQIRIYDLNNIDLRWQNYAPNIKQDATTLADYATAVSPYNRAFSNNYVFFVVYDYDPKWKIEVFEDEQKVSCTEHHKKDPLHLISYATIVYNNGETFYSSLATMTNTKMFAVACKSATSTVTIKVTDRFGRVYTETATRPKPFGISEYETKGLD